MRLYLVRHADVTTRPELPGRLWHLSPEGRRQAEELGRQPSWSGVQGLHTSSEPKALATAQRIAAANELPIRIERDLREVEGRAFVDRDTYLEQARRYLAGEPVEGWEPREPALARMRGCIERIVARHRDMDVGIVSHGLVLTLYVGEVLDLDTTAAHELWSRMRFPDVGVLDPNARRLERDFGASREV